MGARGQKAPQHPTPGTLQASHSTQHVATGDGGAAAAGVSFMPLVKLVLFSPNCIEQWEVYNKIQVEECNF